LILDDEDVHDEPEEKVKVEQDDFMDDKNRTGLSTSHVSSWFCSYPAGSYPRDQGQTIDPDQDRLFQGLTISP